MSFADTDERFDPFSLQIAYLVSLYIGNVLERWGSRQAWIEDIGSPISPVTAADIDLLFPDDADEELALLFLPGGVDRRIKRYMQWAGYDPLGLFYGRWHVIAISVAYDNPDLWRPI